MNYLKEEKVKEVSEMLIDGNSIRQAQYITGCSRVTIRKIKRELREKLGYSIRCKCGSLSSHQGWCEHRFKNSIARQNFIRQWTGWDGEKRDKSKRTPKPLTANFNYPFGAQDNLLDLINTLVPKSISNLIRGDLCQDIALAVLSGDITKEEINVKLPEYLKAARAFSIDRFKYVSIHDKARGHENKTNGEVLGIL